MEDDDDGSSAFATAPAVPELGPAEDTPVDPSLQRRQNMLPRHSMNSVVGRAGRSMDVLRPHTFSPGMGPPSAMPGLATDSMLASTRVGACRLLLLYTSYSAPSSSPSVCIQSLYVLCCSCCYQRAESNAATAGKVPLRTWQPTHPHALLISSLLNHLHRGPAVTGVGYPAAVACSLCDQPSVTHRGTGHGACRAADP